MLTGICTMHQSRRYRSAHWGIILSPSFHEANSQSSPNHLSSRAS
uniref:Uncharacterized protein n=1 Tax=Arundo donax TaxID=35708 RepID=A0A0A9B6Y4_ARUDO